MYVLCCLFKNKIKLYIFFFIKQDTSLVKKITQIQCCKVNTCRFFFIGMQKLTHEEHSECFYVFFLQNIILNNKKKKLKGAYGKHLLK